MQFTNEDPQSTVGRQTVSLFHVVLNTIPLAYLEDDSEDPITFDSDFTFDDCGCLEAFQLPGKYEIGEKHMSETVRDLYGFLHPEITPEKEVIVSARFKGKDGKPVPFVIRPLEQEVCDRIQRTCIKTDKKGNSTADRTKVCR
ncbi:MAG: phage tail tube protein [Clostridium fessum]